MALFVKLVSLLRFGHFHDVCCSFTLCLMVDGSTDSAPCLPRHLADSIRRVPFG